jgi:hypothetical protein
MERRAFHCSSPDHRKLGDRGVQAVSKNDDRQSFCLERCGKPREGVEFVFNNSTLIGCVGAHIGHQVL